MRNLPRNLSSLTSADDIAEDKSSIRRSGLRKIGLGVAGLIGSVILLAALYPLVDSPVVMQKLLIPVGIAAFCCVAVGLLQCATGGAWGDNPQWVRLLALIVIIPLTFASGAVLLAVIARSI